MTHIDLGGLAVAAVVWWVVILHLQTRSNPERNLLTRTLWRYYSATWVSSANPDTRLWIGTLGFVAVGLFAVGAACLIAPSAQVPTR